MPHTELLDLCNKILDKKRLLTQLDSESSSSFDFDSIGKYNYSIEFDKNPGENFVLFYETLNKNDLRNYIYATNQKIRILFNQVTQTITLKKDTTRNYPDCHVFFIGTSHSFLPDLRTDYVQIRMTVSKEGVKNAGERTLYAVDGNFTNGPDKVPMEDLNYKEEFSNEMKKYLINIDSKLLKCIEACKRTKTQRSIFSEEVVNDSIPGSNNTRLDANI